MLCYVFLGHGPKPLEPVKLADLPAARTQLANFKLLTDRVGGHVRPRYIVEHARTVRSLQSLPRLHALLPQVRDLGGAIFLDEIDRIVRKCELGNRADLLAELQVFGDQINLLRPRKKLSAFNRAELLSLVAQPRTTALRLTGSRAYTSTPHERQDQTDAARIQSERVRGQRADALAEKLDAIRMELRTVHPKVTNAMIADEANRRGILTARGKHWMPSTVARALKRLEDA